MKIVSICVIITASLNCCVLSTAYAVNKEVNTTKKANRKKTKPSEETHRESSSEDVTSATESTDSEWESSEEDPVSSTTQSSSEKPESNEGSSESSTTQSSAETTETSEENSSSTQTSHESKKTNDANTVANTTGTPVEHKEIIESTSSYQAPTKGASSEKVDESKFSATSKRTSTKKAEIINFESNQTTKDFIEKIGNDARKLGLENDLYASVMIAQAILESASGNSLLASPPHYNLFGIKGKYQGLSVSFATSEDDGKGNLYTIQANFKKYSSYRESLEDYVLLIKKGLTSNPNYYADVWKSNTTTYKDATKALTGKYATDSEYAAKLNGLIHTYSLVEYDKKISEFDSEKKESINNKSDVKGLRRQSVLPVAFNKTLKNTNICVSSINSFQFFKNANNLYQVPLEQVISRERLNRTFSKSENSIQIERIRNGWKFVIVENHTNGRYWKPEINYIVKKGDSLKKISNYVGISVYSLRSWNDLTKHLIYEGQILKLMPDWI